VLGVGIASAVMFAISFVPNKAIVYLTLGLMPFAIEILPAKLRPNIEWRGVPFVTGILTTIIQVLAGVGGLFLDIFFQKSVLERMTDHGFRRWTRVVIFAASAVYLMRAAWLLWPR
jgi:hypothetical protein